MRSSVQDFSLANPIYASATVTFYTVSAGVKTTTKATLYNSLSGVGTLSNPQYLDVDGKFLQAVYIAEDVVASVTGLTIEDHDTGIIQLVASYSTGSFTGTLTGGTTAPTSTIDYVQLGETVLLTGDYTGFSATSNSTAKTITGLPAALWPATEQVVPIIARDNSGLFVASVAVIGTDGAITVDPSLETGTWTASGTCGVRLVPAEYITA